MAIKHYLAELEAMAPAEVKKTLDLRAQEMKNSVIFAKNHQPKNERVIYVSNDGCDDCDGLSKEKPIKSLEKLAELQKEGDTVLFRRGDHFRGIIIVKEGVTYSAYGCGIKPILDGSRKNYADPSLWEETDVKNVWHLKEFVNNVGLIHFDPSYTYGEYNELYGKFRAPGLYDFKDYQDLKEDLEFYSTVDRCSDEQKAANEDKHLYLYSEKGNPGERFMDIEIAERFNMFNGNADNVTIDNLWITHVGAHGMGGAGGSKNRVITNCVFSWLGGSILALNFRNSGKPVRFGNAIEIYGGCDGYRVENNWMYQIYDTAVTHQFSGGNMDCVQQNVVYKHNLMEFCFWFIEYYNAPDTTGNYKRAVHNVYMNDNFCRFGGYGWGCKGREGGTPMYCGSSVCDDVENVLVENNIFYQSLGYLVVLSNSEGHKKEVMKNNVYVNPENEKFANLYGKVYNFDDSAKDMLREIVHEEEPTFVYMKRPDYKF